MTRTTTTNIVARTALAVIAAIAAAACGANESVLKSGKPDPNAANSVSQGSSVDRVVSDMRTAGFTTVFVIRRKDGGKIDSEDRGVIRFQTAEANRRIGTDDEKAFIIGSNVPIAADKMEILTGRFAIEDLSPQNANANANANK